LSQKRLIPPGPGVTGLEDRLAGTLAHGLGINFRGRLSGLDDLRRHVRILRDALAASGPDVSLDQLRGEVDRLVREEPFRLGAELSDALASASALAGWRGIGELCQSMEDRQPPLLRRGAAERRTYRCPSSDLQIEVETYMPAVSDRSRVPLLVVLHGFMREPARYLEPWIPLAAAHGFAVIAPEFHRGDFPGSLAYNQGGLFSPVGDLQPQERWLFGHVERLFDAAREWVGTRTRRYCLYGHSAGAQVVHRMVLAAPDARVSMAVAANAGWYTLPTFDLDFPYGLGRLPVTEAGLRRSLGTPLVVLLGEADSDPDDPLLRRSPEALAQGAHRLARGVEFHRQAQDAATRRGVPLAWTRQQVPGVGHDHEAMAAVASKILLENHK